MTRRDFLTKSALAAGGLFGVLGFRNVERVYTSAERVEEKPKSSTDFMLAKWDVVDYRMDKIYTMGSYPCEFDLVNPSRLLGPI